MPVSSLNRMTVPNGFATDQSPTDQGLLMPKLKYRFRVQLQNFGIDADTLELTRQVIDFTRPSVSFEEIPIDIYNSKIYLAGKHSWEALTLNVRDDASNSVARLVGQQLQKQLDFFEQASAASGIDYKFKTVCEILDGGNGAVAPTVLETWEILGCYLSAANYNDLNYAESAAVQIALTIRFDNAIQTTGGVGIGTAVGRTVAGAVTGLGTGA